MFYSITGKIVYEDAQSVAVDCSGIALRCFTSLNTLKKCGGTGSSVTLYTYLSVREDAMELFGFYENSELECFKLLIGVSGIGPKAAMSVLSLMTPSVLALSIASGDVKAITRAQGIGMKTAQRIVLELKDKMAKTAPTDLNASEFAGASAPVTGNISEAVSALVSLGFAAGDALKALGGSSPDMSVEELIKQGLKMLSRGI